MPNYDEVRRLRDLAAEQFASAENYTTPDGRYWARRVAEFTAMRAAHAERDYSNEKGRSA